MIVFSGYLHCSTQKYLLKRVQKITAKGAVIMFLLIVIPSLFVWIYGEIWVFFVISLFGTLGMFVITRQNLIDACPTRIVIDVKSNEIYGEYRRGVGSRSIDDVKNVIDMGTFYHILFYFPKQWANCICQKDLIVEGTIEEFEKLFEDKIVRKYQIKD